MSNWRDSILQEFVPHVSRLTLVADPDSLLTEEKLSLELRARRFDLIEFNDHVEFRYAYESQYRSIWDRGEHTDLVVILRLEDTELESLPFDLLQKGRKLAFSLGNLFPNMSYPVIEQLDRGDLDALFEAQTMMPAERMGDNATKDFILRHVFRIAPELINNEVHLLQTLLRLHYSKTQVPDLLIQRFIELLRTQEAFTSWPLEQIIPDSSLFYAFLQERWPKFLEMMGKTYQVGEGASKYSLKFPGPNSLPFDHQDIRIYIDNLFLEGKLTPIEMDVIDTSSHAWVRSGIVTEESADDECRISGLFELVQEQLPSIDARHSEWIQFALKWAELSSLVHCAGNVQQQSRLKDFGGNVNQKFSLWLEQHFASLINLPPTNPAMVHQIPRHLARKMEECENNAVALIVLDGLSLDQWVTVRHILKTQIENLVMRESATMAWIPTLTSVSRQSIFSGKEPLYFPASIKTTNNEVKLWKQFWEGYGLSRLDVAYKRGLGDGNVFDALEATIHPQKTKVVGLVVDKIDKIMHGMQLGTAGMHNQIKQWCQGKFLADLIELLLDRGYQLWLTADHGNIEGAGAGRPSEGVLAETRGERVRVYPTAELRAQVAESFPSAHEWNPIGLPSDFYPLLAGGYDAFVSPGKTIVGHGSMAIEEAIVPLVKLEKRVQ